MSYQNYMREELGNLFLLMVILMLLCLMLGIIIGYKIKEGEIQKQNYTVREKIINENRTKLEQILGVSKNA